MAKKTGRALKISLAMKKSWAEKRASPMREQARKRAVAEKAEAKSESDRIQPKFYILWMPTSHKPPRVRFATLGKVEEVADKMVNKYHQPIYIMASVQLHSPGKPEVVKYSGPEQKGAVVQIKSEPQVRDDDRCTNREETPLDQDQENAITQLGYRRFRT